MLNLNGLDIPSFVKVTNVEYSVLPTMTNNTLSVRGRKGVYLYGQDLTERKINAEITIIAEEINGVMAKTRELAAWLYHSQPVKLITADEPDKYYKVIPDGETNIAEVMKTGTGVLSFLCIDAFAYGEDKEFYFSSVSGGMQPVLVEGSAETYPEIELTVNEDIDTISVIAGEGHVMIGEPAPAIKTPTNRYPAAFIDHMENIASWTNGVTVDGGFVTGNLVSTNGYGVSQEGKDYGTGTGWHGAAKIRALPKPLQNFEVKAWVTVNASHINQMGRVEVYLRDVNGKHLGKIALLENSTTAEQPVIEARAGDVNEGDGHYFVSGLQTAFKNFYGTLQLSRRGLVWTAVFSMYSKGKVVRTFRKTWTDTAMKYRNPLASVQIHIGAFSNKAPIDAMQVSRVDVYEYVELSATQAPIIAEAGDVLIIDSANSLLYKNGEVFYEGINPSSTFFSLDAGVNGLYVTVPNTDVKVRYTERWL